MKASQFSDAQKAFILKQGADGVPVAEICRRAGISDEEKGSLVGTYGGRAYASKAIAIAAYKPEPRW